MRNFFFHRSHHRRIPPQRIVHAFSAYSPQIVVPNTSFTLCPWSDRMFPGTGSGIGLEKKRSSELLDIQYHHHRSPSTLLMTSSATACEAAYITDWYYPNPAARISLPNWIKNGRLQSFGRRAFSTPLGSLALCFSQEVEFFATVLALFPHLAELTLPEARKEYHPLVHVEMAVEPPPYLQVVLKWITIEALRFDAVDNTTLSLPSTEGIRAHVTAGVEPVTGYGFTSPESNGRELREHPLAENPEE
ncbi:hypothetical protein B0H16DRAFT_1689862 [Mycena metata]|uniref:Uncharacterized protein n=1 Tax=Mycena metata TaxID=1033252 RepID=A0AAD7J4N4_9AGAR|nr:hypothetical protein B0H16DRAFT_1689862 [Mycena metata]